MVRNQTPTRRVSVAGKMKEEIAVYPKVKVREEKSPEDRSAADDQKRGYLFSLKDFESLFLEESSSSSVLLFTGKEHRVSPPSTAKIPQAYCPNIAKPSTSDSQDAEKRCEKVDDDIKVNIRTSSIPMPRAVISSPENDLMIGKKNKKRAEKASVLKNHNSVPSRHAQCKIIPSHGSTENAITSRNPKEAADSKPPLIRKNPTAHRACSLKLKTTP